MPDDRTYFLVMAAVEAAGNAVKHAGKGLARIRVRDSKVQVSIKDEGSGMDALILPKATLMSRYSTKPSMGLGYALILASVDSVYLATGEGGTDILLEDGAKTPPQELTLDKLPDTW
jgi:anti-sigma regulatory factor (Ser/Thr protein kinase)